MLPHAFETYLREARIDRVTIFRSTPESAWSIYAYGDELSPEVTTAPSHLRRRAMYSPAFCCRSCKRTG